MATGELLVTPQELDAIAGRVEEQVFRYKSCYERIYGEVDNLSATWKGEANMAFVTQIRGFQNDFEALQNLLAKYGEFLRVAANNYQRSENVNIENARLEITGGK